MLAAEAFLHSAFDFAIGGSLGYFATLVVLALAAGDGDLELDDAVFGVELQGDEGFPFLLALADEAVDLFSVQEELAVAGGELAFLPGVRVGRDMGPDQEDFPVPDPRVALLEVGPALPDGFYLWSGKLDARLVGLLDVEVVQHLLVAREIRHRCFTTLSSARCISGRTSSNSTRTLSPTL